MERIVYGGYGLGKIKNKVYLIRFSAPKEVVKFKLLKEKPDYGEGVVEKVILPSQVRREPPCKYFTYCGGCQLQHLNYESQVSSKEEVVLETLSRMAKIKDIKEVKVYPSKEEFNYRLRVSLHKDGSKLGFIAWREKEVVDVESCPLLHPKINKILPNLRETLREFNFIKEVHVFYSPLRDEFLIKLISIKDNYLQELKGIKDSLPKEVVGVGFFSRINRFLSRRSFLGRDYTFLRVRKYTYRVNVESFFQSNYTLYSDFQEAVLDLVEDFKKGIELYGGVGFFSLPVSERGNYLEVSDYNPHSVRDGDYNARLNSRHNLKFLRLSAQEHLKERLGEEIDLLLMDPPRSGLSGGEMPYIKEMKPKRIIYVSCNPTTFARDLKLLKSFGYELESLKILDNFPQTYHVEVVGLLKR